MASFLLVAVTNHLTQNVASIPFLWILPLTLYLLTFILCFDGRGWYRRIVFFPLAGLAVAAMAWVLTDSDLIHNLKLSIPLFAAGLFVLCMLCHGELVMMKPVPARLTEFYMLIALGGALGSMVVSVIAPHLLPGDFEVAVGLALAAVVLAWKVAPVGRIALAGALAAVAFTGYGVVTYVSNNVADTRVMKRNFYSSLRTRDEVRDEGTVRKLIHGTINHGEQFVDADKRRQAIAYFGPKAGIVRALEALRHPDMRVGIVGLGAGTMAAYGRTGDVYRFYEINPQVIELAQTEFSYLKDSDAKIELVLGDGRLALESEPPQRFDLLAADAFSSDSVPMHLMTKEALALYMRHVRPGGVVVFNVTNRYLDLAPVVKRLADSLGLHARLVSHMPDDVEYNIYSITDFVLVTADPKLFDRPELAEVAAPIEVPRKVTVWTDDFNNLLQALR
jgi:SAM-dependent methyltransferase